MLGIGNLGAIVGAFTATRLGQRFGVGPVIVGAMLISGPATLLVPFASYGPAIPILLVAQALTGFSAVVYNINQVSLRQSITPERMQGRMNATMRFIVWGTMPIGATIGGVIATAVGVTQALWVGGILACTAFLPVALGPVRRLREFPRAADEASDAVVAEASMSGLEPIGFSMPRSLDGIAEGSVQERSDPGAERGDSEGAGHGQNGSAE